jgi:streptogramin lyase
VRIVNHKRRPGLWLCSQTLACFLCLNIAWPVRAQTAPAITTQPVSQTNLAGANVALNVAVSGTGPFSYQWQFNGANLPTNIITTVAGKGGGFSGDSGQATNASLADPIGIACDAKGNLWIADTGNSRIRKVDTNGIITTVAGNGTNAFSGDGGPATNATLSSPQGICCDAGATSISPI